MSPLSNAILGLLSYKPLTGYEIKLAFDGPLQLAWSASYGGLYPQLHRLELQKLISLQTIIQDGKPNKKVYTLTKKGKEALTVWLRKPVSKEATKNEFLLKIFLLSTRDTELSQLILQERKEYIARQIKSLHSATFNHNPYYDYGLTRYQQELKWLDKQLKSIKTKRVSSKTS